jgi:hypothetical protein
LGLAWNGKPSHSPALFYTCAPCGSLLRCKVTVIYNAVKQVVGGQNGTAQDKSGQGFQGTFFLPFFASDFNIESKIERNIPIRKE